MRISDWSSDVCSSDLPKRIPFPEASYSASLDDNPEYDVTKLRIGYESMVTPDTIYDYHLATGDLEVLKVQEIPSGYDATRYRSEEHTSELQSLMRNSYAVFCLKKKKTP